MPTISREAIQEVRDELASKDEIIAELEEELVQMSEELETLRTTMKRWVADRSTDV